MEVQKGHIGPLEAHSLFCLLGELEESNGDGNGSIGWGNQGCLLPWRALGGVGSHLLLSPTFRDN
jgi:hypothetical protein